MREAPHVANVTIHHTNSMAKTPPRSRAAERKKFFFVEIRCDFIGRSVCMDPTNVIAGESNAQKETKLNIAFANTTAAAAAAAVVAFASLTKRSWDI